MIITYPRDEVRKGFWDMFWNRHGYRLWGMFRDRFWDRFGIRYSDQDEVTK